VILPHLEVEPMMNSDVMKPTLRNLRAWAEGKCKQYTGLAMVKDRPDVEVMRYMADKFAVLLDKGELFTERKRSKERPEECYRDPFMVCLNSELPCYEGFYVQNGCTSPYCWNVQEGKVIDVIQDNLGDLWGPSDGVWFGAPLSKEAIARRIVNAEKQSPARCPSFLGCPPDSGPWMAYSLSSTVTGPIPEKGPSAVLADKISLV